MQNIKTFLVWLFFGYSNRAIRTGLKYDKNNLFFLGVNDEILEFNLFIPNGLYSYETYKVFENKGKMFLKPKIDTKILYKAVFIYPTVFGFLMGNFKENGLIWAFVICLIINLCSFFNQFKNNQILKSKIAEIVESMSFIKYLKMKRLKLAIERLFNFKNRTKSEFEIYLQKQDITILKETLNDKEFLSDWDYKFIDSLSVMNIEFELQINVYKELINYLEEFLRYNLLNDFKSQNLKIMKLEVDCKILKDSSFFENLEV